MARTRAAWRSWKAASSVNPIRAVVDAVRGLMLGGPVGGAVAKTVAWMVALTVVFAPLAVARYRRRV
jgi:ABC-type polysaccharide/polyol phosphate export permease